MIKLKRIVSIDWLIDFNGILFGAKSFRELRSIYVHIVWFGMVWFGFMAYQPL